MSVLHSLNVVTLTSPFNHQQCLQEATCDIVFSAGHQSLLLLPAQKLILCSISPMLLELIRNLSSCEQKSCCIILPDIVPETVNNLLTLVNSGGSLSVPSISSVGQIMELVELLQMKNLKDIVIIGTRTVHEPDNTSGKCNSKLPYAELSDHKELASSTRLEASLSKVFTGETVDTHPTETDVTEKAGQSLALEMQVEEVDGDETTEITENIDYDDSNNENDVADSSQARNEKCTEIVVWRTRISEKLKEHRLNRLHSVANKSTFKCSSCFYSTKSKASLRYHRLRHSANKMLSCESCSFRSTRNQILEYHMRKHTSDTAAERTTRMNSAVKAISFSHYISHYSSTEKAHLQRLIQVEARNKRFKCDRCPYSTAYKQSLEAHIHNHTVEKLHIRPQEVRKPFKCDHCSYVSTKKYYLQRHMLIHTDNKLFTCEYCSISLTDKTSMKLHIRTHTGERPYPCKLCNYAAARIDTLKDHVKVKHTEYSKAFLCEQCPYSTHTKFKLGKHMTSHSQYRPFKCELCPFSFSFKSGLIRHLSTHSRNDVVACDICHRTVRSKSLKGHKRLHSARDRFKCPHCPHSSCSAEALKAHERMHVGERQFKCNVCSFSSVIQYAVTKHEKVHVNCTT